MLYDSIVVIPQSTEEFKFMKIKEENKNEACHEKKTL